MRILITGASGYVGRHLAERLSQSEHEVTCMVRKRGSATLPSSLYSRIVEADALRPNTLPCLTPWPTSTSRTTSSIPCRVEKQDSTSGIARPPTILRSLQKELEYDVLFISEDSQHQVGQFRFISKVAMIQGRCCASMDPR